VAPIKQLSAQRPALREVHFAIAAGAWNAICVIRLPCTRCDTLTHSIAPILLANGTIMTKPLLSVSGLAAQPLRRDSDRLDFA
jgi:hypothetical protein